MFQKFPSVENFHTLRKYLPKLAEFRHTDDVSYRGKIKLHGTNAGVVITPKGEVYAQKRSSLIDTTCDNLGFAAWLEGKKDFFSNLAHDKHNVYVYGEWCGNGIQSGVAISQIEKKIFAIFAIQFGSNDDRDTMVMVDPDVIMNLCTTNKNLKFFDHIPHDVEVLPWHTTNMVVNFYNETKLNGFVDCINEFIDEIDEVDPYVENSFGVKGTGEGLVMYPTSFMDDGMIRREVWSGLMFKAKGIKHSVNKNKNNKAVQADPEEVKTAKEFAEKFVTEARCEQMATEISKDGNPIYVHRMIGPFIGAISKDVKKESKAELEVSGLEWKFVNKFITNVAREWYMKKIAE